MKKRIFSVILTVVMLIGILPVSVLAADPAHSHTVCNDSNICSDPTHTSIEWEPLPDDRTSLSEGSYYLTTNVILESTLVISANINLCLNGKTLSLDSSKVGSVIEVQGGATLTLCDCGGNGKITGGNATNGGGINVSANSTLNMYGGTITKNTATKGGGVYIASNATVKMYDGNVTGNLTTDPYADYGGDIYKNGTFQLYGGTYGGTWGGIDWSFVVTNFNDGTGTLTIAPTTNTITLYKPWSNPKVLYSVGELPAAVNKDVSAITAPPYNRNKVTKLIIKEGVISLGSFSLQSMTNIKEGVVIPTTVKYIGQSALSGSSFTAITFADGSQIKCIDNGAMQGTQITTIEFPETLEHIHEGVLCNNTKLEHVVFQSQNLFCGRWHHDYDGHTPECCMISDYEKQIFCYCDNLKTITFYDKNSRNAVLQDPNIWKSIIVPPTNSEELVVYTIEGLIDAALKNGQNSAVLKYTTRIDNHTSSYSSGEKIVVPEGFKLIIPSGVTLTNDKELTVLGDIEIQDGGKLQNRGAIYSVSGATKLNGVAESNNNEKYGGSNPGACYTITYNLNDGTVQGTNPDYYHSGLGSKKLITPTRTGYKFIGWSGTGLTGDTNLEVDLKDALDGYNGSVAAYTANWKIEDYKLSFSDDDCDFRINQVTIGDNLVPLPITNAHYDQEISFTAHNLQKVTLSTGDPVHYDGNGTYSFTMPDADVVIYIEVDLDKIDSSLDTLESKIEELNAAINDKASAEDLDSAVETLESAIETAKDASKTYTDEQLAELKEALKEAEIAISAAKTRIDELEGRVDSLEDAKTDLEDAINALNTAIGKVDITEGDLVARINKLSEAIEEAKEIAKNYTDAEIAKLKTALEAADAAIAAAEKRLADLEGKVEDLEKDKDALEKAVAELKAAMTSSNEALAKEIKDLNAALEAAKKSASNVDAELKKAIEDSEAALTAAVDELKKRVASIESVLDTANKNINTNTTDIATLKASIKTIELLQSEAEKTIKSLEILIGTNTANITGLQESVTKLQESIYDADGKIAAAEARIAVLEGKVEELEGVKNELLASVTNLQNALANKADRAMVNSAVASLQGSIFALQSAQNNYVAADTALKNELTAAINAAKELAISTAKDLVSQSATELQAAIDKKADSATLEAKAGELAEAIALAETTSKAYADAQDALLKEALDAELLAANELINSLGIRMTDAEAAINALESAVEALQKVTADDAQALKDAVASLSQALADAKALAAESDTALETALGLVISEAQKALEAKISDVQSGLNKAIKDLKAADASNADELKKAIKSIEDAMAAAESARDAADSALESKLTEAQNELTRKIAEVQANLDTAKTELGKAIESGDNSLGEKIKELNEALEAAKAATEASDVTLKTELTAKIDEADAAIYALIEKLRKELQESNVELNTAIEEGDDELNTQFIVSTSVAGVGVAGNIGLLAWIIISKKRRLF